MIVEDEQDLIKLLKYNLEKGGFRVSYTTDGSLALAEIRRDAPDLLMLDLMLPGMDGLEVCREVKKISPTIPVILLTARDDMVTRAAAMDLGVSEFIAKPVNNADLLNRVRTQLSNVAWDKAADQAVAKIDKPE